MRMRRAMRSPRVSLKKRCLGREGSLKKRCLGREGRGMNRARQVIRLADNRIDRSIGRSKMPFVDPCFTCQRVGHRAS